MSVFVHDAQVLHRLGVSGLSGLAKPRKGFHVVSLYPVPVVVTDSLPGHRANIAGDGGFAEPVHRFTQITLRAVTSKIKISAELEHRASIPGIGLGAQRRERGLRIC